VPATLILVPATLVPATLVPATLVPATLVPATLVPATLVPATLVLLLVPVPGPKNMLLPLLRKNGFSCFWVQGDWFGAGVVKNGFFGMACMHVMCVIILTRFLKRIVYVFTFTMKNKK